LYDLPFETQQNVTLPRQSAQQAQKLKAARYKAQGIPVRAFMYEDKLAPDHSMEYYGLVSGVDAQYYEELRGHWKTLKASEAFLETAESTLGNAYPNFREIVNQPLVAMEKKVKDFRREMYYKAIQDHPGQDVFVMNIDTAKGLTEEMQAKIAAQPLYEKSAFSNPERGR
jgi:hypothetical protein